jgi:hypothetical protein
LGNVRDFLNRVTGNHTAVAIDITPSLSVVLVLELERFQRWRCSSIDKMANGQANIKDTSKATMGGDGAEIADANTLSFVSSWVVRWFRDPQRVANSLAEKDAGICLRCAL